MTFSIEIEENKIDDMAKLGWLAKYATRGKLEVRPDGREKAVETMQKILASKEGESPDVEKNDLYVTQIYLATVIEPNLIWKKKYPVT
jgi:hypothetical protein